MQRKFVKQVRFKSRLKKYHVKTAAFRTFASSHK